MEVYTGLTRKGMTMSKSSPSMAAAFSLREYSQGRKRIPSLQGSAPDISLEEIDRLGGNGRWRQRKAEVFFQEQSEKELQRLREQRAYEEKRRKRRMEIEARRKRQQQEEEEKREMERERERRELEEKEEKRRKEEERERQIREQEERDWKARQPYTCEPCKGTGRCTRCEGTGQVFSLFLVSQVEKTANMDFGRAAQGCEDCGGCQQNIMGSLKLGSGDCPTCAGKGKVWPKVAFEKQASRTRIHRFQTSSTFVGGDMSPKSTMSSPKAFHNAP